MDNIKIAGRSTRSHLKTPDNYKMIGNHQTVIKKTIKRLYKTIKFDGTSTKSHSQINQKPLENITSL